MIASYLFRLLNFFLLIGFGRYMFIRYGRETILEKIAEKIALFRSLTERIGILKKESQDTNTAITEAETGCQQHAQRVKIWRTVVESQQSIRAGAAQELYQKACVRRDIKQEYLIGQVLKRELSAAVFERTHAELEKRFASSSEQERYIAQITASLQNKMQDQIQDQIQNKVTGS